MGLVNAARALFAGARSFLAPSVPAVVTRGAPEGIAAVARRIAPAVGAGAAGGGLFAGLSSLFGGGDNGAVAPAAGPMFPAARGAGGSTFVTLDDGSRVLVSPSGNVARPQLFLPAGAKLPGGATIVSISPGGDLFGVRRKRRTRKFGAEIDRCKDTIRAADSLIKAVRKR